MKLLLVMLFSLIVSVANAKEIVELSPESLKIKVMEINKLQNNIFMSGSQVTDIDKLFSTYTDEFEYIHEVYGGTYTRDHLYGNYVKSLKAGNYKRTGGRYNIVSMIVGHNAVSVERQQTYKGVTANHLAVFEFEGNKVSKIIEYWK